MKRLFNWIATHLQCSPRRFSISIIISVVFFNFPVYADSDPNVTQKLEKFITNMEVELSSLTGGAIAIIAGDNVVYQKVFGHTKANGSLINEDTLFSLASTSKPIVATGIGALVDKGLVQFNNEIKLNFIKNKMSIRHFLSHTTGYIIRGDSEIENGYSRPMLLRYLAKQKPNYKPGQAYGYSNLMYSVVAEFLQSKKYTLKMLVDALNINTTSNMMTLLPLEQIDNIAHLHSSNKKELTIPSNYQKSVPASAGIFSSLNGMIEFLQIALGNRPNIISQNTLDELYKPVITANDSFKWNLIPFNLEEIRSWYGLGWRIIYLADNYESRLVFHSGYINGAATFIGLLPHYKTGIVILSNQSSKFALKNGLDFWKTLVLSYY